MRNYLILLFSIAVLSGCYDATKPVPKWKEGDFVRSILSHQRGQIISIHCWKGNASCAYSVRFVGMALSTNTHLLAQDGTIDSAPLSVIPYMEEYELVTDATP